MNMVVQRNMIKIIIVNTNKITIKEMESQHFKTQNKMTIVALKIDMMNLDQVNQKRIKMKLDTMIIIIKMITEEDIAKTIINTITIMIFKIKEDNEI